MKYKVHKVKSEYKEEVLLCHYFNGYWIDLRSNETFVQYFVSTSLFLQQYKFRKVYMKAELPIHLYFTQKTTSFRTLLCDNFSCKLYLSALVVQLAPLRTFYSRKSFSVNQSLFLWEPLRNHYQPKQSKIHELPILVDNFFCCKLNLWMFVCHQFLQYFILFQPWIVDLKHVLNYSIHSRSKMSMVFA